MHKLKWFPGMGNYTVFQNLSLTGNVKCQEWMKGVNEGFCLRFAHLSHLV